MCRDDARKLLFPQTRSSKATSKRPHSSNVQVRVWRAKLDREEAVRPVADLQLIRNESGPLLLFTSYLIENFSYFLSQPAKSKWLAQQVNPRIKPAVVNYRIARVARRE
jgi:hypothetical protein